MFTRYHVVIRDENNFVEKIPFNFSPAKLLMCTFFVTLIFMSLGLLLSNTILRKWVNSAYLEQENEKKLALLYESLENLAAKNAIQDKFIASFQDVLTGKVESNAGLETIPSDFSTSTIPSYQEEKTDIFTQEEYSDIANKPIPHQLNPIYTTKTDNTPTSIFSNSDVFISPIDGGVITTAFNPYEHYGVDILGKANEPIKSIADGRVILSSFTVETGWVMLIQHSAGVLSLYKHNAVLFKQKNDFVQKGEVIAIMGNSGKFTTGPHLHFEIWHDGNALNPEAVIKF